MNNPIPDPDEARILLEVRSGAGEKEIIRAYRTKASQWHPDRNPSPRAAEMFNRITRAREVLLEELRSPRADTTAPTPPPGPEPEDPWRSAPTADGSTWGPRAEPQAPSDPWAQEPPYVTRPTPPGSYWYSPPGSAPWFSHPSYPAPPPRGRGSAISALVTATLMLMSCCFVFALPSVVLAAIALSRSHDHEEGPRYERYAWISIGITLAGGLAIGLALMDAGDF